jgi:hypothetical protein
MVTTAGSSARRFRITSVLFLSSEESSPTSRPRRLCATYFVEGRLGRDMNRAMSSQRRTETIKASIKTRRTIFIICTSMTAGIQNQQRRWSHKKPPRPILATVSVTCDATLPSPCGPQDDEARTGTYLSACGCGQNHGVLHHGRELARAMQRLYASGNDERRLETRSSLGSDGLPAGAAGRARYRFARRLTSPSSRGARATLTCRAYRTIFRDQSRTQRRTNSRPRGRP